MNTPRNRFQPQANGTPAQASPAPGATPVERRAGEPRRLDSQSLFGHNDVVLIHHAGEIYRLQRTRLGKLILTK